MLDVLSKILEAIGFRRGMLRDHSDGASMAAAYAGTIDDPGLTGLVLMGPHFFVELGTLPKSATPATPIKLASCASGCRATTTILTRPSGARTMRGSIPPSRPSTFRRPDRWQ